ncbi:MAG: hypothetical protein M3680_36710 [Myxococcota bacterium]|nr:hypothetical protein [Myxococcota bacterium]
MAPRLLLSLLCCAATTAVVAAEPAPSEPVPAQLPSAVSYRMFSAYSSRVGCSAYILSCEGLDRFRQGFTASSGSLNDEDTGTGLVVTYQAAARQTTEAVLTSQVIATAGVRKRVGRGWVQGGAGIANAAVMPGPKAISAQQAASRDGARAAVAVGVGVDLGTKARPLSISIDAGSSLEGGDDGRIQQAAATVIHKF